MTQNNTDQKKILPLSPNEIAPLAVFRLENKKDPTVSDFTLPEPALPYLVVNLSVLDPKRWVLDTKRNVWRYTLDGGLQYICSASQPSPDNAVLADSLDRLYIAVFWMENIVPEVVNSYWMGVRGITDMWEMLYSHRFDNVQQAAATYGRILADGGKKK